jgi:RNA polymerase sigma factor (sigma-70 family)
MDGTAMERPGLDDPTDKLATAALTAAMAAGDPAAVEAFYRRYFDRLYAWARQATRRDEAFCLDVVQDAVLRVVRTVRPASGEAQLVAWLKLVVRTTAYDRLKADRRRDRRHRAAALADVPAGNPAGSTAVATADDDDPSDPADLAERLGWLRAELDAMDPGLARLIDLRFTERWTLARIGGLLGVSVGTVDGRLRRALARLRERAGSAFGE